MAVKPDALFHALCDDLASVLPPGTILGDQWGPEFTTKQVAAAQLGRTLLKKFSFGRTTEEGDSLARDRFVRANERCDQWTFRPETPGDYDLLSTFKNVLNDFWFPEGNSLVFSYHSIFENGRTGPGSSLGARGTDMYTKLFDSPLTATKSSLYEYYRTTKSVLPLWNSAELQRLNHHDELVLVKGSRICFVEKDDSISRLIAVEPSLNMFAQLGLGCLLEKRLDRYFGIDLAVQPDFNRELARLGSLHDNLATLDLKEASDSVSMKMLTWALPAEFLRWLSLFRSPVMEDGKTCHEMHMVSSMGNGFTFPLETLVLSAAVVATLHTLGIKPEKCNRVCQPGQGYLDRGTLNQEGVWGVFGDDIIIHRVGIVRLLRLLDLLGFKVNSDKSYFEGPFRESCGRDFHHGYNVRGVYIKRLLSRQDHVVAINNLVAWSSRCQILIPRTIGLLLAAVGGLRKLPLVPLADADDAGLRVPFSCLQDLYKVEYSREIVQGAVIYRRYQARSRSLSIGDGYISVPAKEKKRFYNASGLLLAFLHGEISGGRISVRQTEVRYRTKRCITPYWDYVPPFMNPEMDFGGFRCWRNTVGFYLFD